MSTTDRLFTVGAVLLGVVLKLEAAGRRSVPRWASAQRLPGSGSQPRSSSDLTSDIGGHSANRASARLARGRRYTRPMARITFSGGATLHVPGSAAKVASALEAPRNGFTLAKFPGSTARVNPDQIAFISDDSEPPVRR